MLQFFYLFIYCNGKSVLHGLGNFLEEEGWLCNQYLCHLTYWSSPWWLLYDSWDLALQCSLNVTEIDADSVNQAERRSLELILTPHKLENQAWGVSLGAPIQEEKSSLENGESGISLPQPLMTPLSAHTRAHRDTGLAPPCHIPHKPVLSWF